MRNYLLLLILILAIFDIGFAQFKYPDAIILKDETITIPGEGSVTAKAWVKCMAGDELKLKPPIPNDSKYCFIWECRKIEDYTIGIPSNLKGYEVEPVKESAVYWVTVENSDTKVKQKFYFIVYVVEGISLWEMDNTIECMDEYSTIKVFGELKGKGMDRVSTDAEVIEMAYSIDGNDFKKHYKSIIKGKFEDAEFIIPMIDGKIKFKTILPERYLLNIDANWNSLGYCSNRWTIDVFRLWINKFQKSDAPRNWMVVVNYPIEHDVSCISSLTDFKWTTIKTWGELINNTNKSGVNLLISEKQNNLPNLQLNNSDFGPNKGLIILSCKDKKGNDHFVSTLPYFEPIKQFPRFKIKYRCMYQNVFVFFDKMEIRQPINIADNKKDWPNWYRYWSEFVEYPFNNDILATWKPDKGTLAGYTDRILRTKFGNVFKYENWYYNRASYCNNITGHDGIEKFYEVIAHERTHVTIYRENWPSDIYNPTNDLDLNSNGIPSPDYLDKSWEIMNSSRKYPFDPSVDDIERMIIVNGVKIPLVEAYEEDRCQNIERNLIDFYKFNSYDWSYYNYKSSNPNYCTPQIPPQGKNWK